MGSVARMCRADEYVHMCMLFCMCMHVYVYVCMLAVHARHFRAGEHAGYAWMVFWLGFYMCMCVWLVFVGVGMFCVYVHACHHVWGMRGGGYGR